MSDLVERAIELCESEIESWTHHLEEADLWDSYYFRKNLNSWTTHLAEFREHALETENSDSEWYGLPLDKCVDRNNEHTFTKVYPCDFITTKANRLLGEE